MSSASSAGPSPHSKPWEEKNPWIAGILAYLIPGAGHVYQGRTVKGLIYFCSILGLFFWGQKLGEGMVVYNLPEKGGVLRNLALSYAAQMGTGASALPALLQNQRAASPGNRISHRLTRPLVAEFQGRLNPVDDSDSGRLAGTIRLESVEGASGSEVVGTFDGTLDGKPTKLALGGARFELDKPIKAGYRRRLECGLKDEASTFPPKSIVGTIPRPFMDAYGSPPDPDQLQEINGRLGKLYELALVFTWIAGLLNVLAIWDCVLGPAYGFGDEHTSAYAVQPKTESASSPPAPLPPASTAIPPAAQIGSPPTAGAAPPPRVESGPTPKSPV